MAAFSSFVDLLTEIEDPRRAEGKLYRLPHVVLFAILAIVAGANSYRAIHSFIDVHLARLRDAFGVKWRKAPAYTTIRGILRQLDPASVIDGLPHPTNDLGIKKPDGGAVGPDYWTLARGDKDHILRAVFAAPEGQPAVGDLEIGGQKISFGGQIVKAGTGMQVKLTGVVGKPGVFHNSSFPCPGGGTSQLAFGPSAATSRSSLRS